MTMFNSLFPSDSLELSVSPEDDRDPKSQLGLSFNSSLASAGQLAVELSSFPSSAGDYEQDVVLLTSHYELKRFLSISTRAKGNVYGFEFKGSSDYIERRRSKKHSLYAAISVFAAVELFTVESTVALRARVVSDLPSGTSWGDDHDRKNFHEKWGDAYIKESLLGGHAVIVVEITEESYSEYKNFMASFRGKFTDANTGSIRYQRTKQLLQVFKEVKAKAFVRGAPTDPPIEAKDGDTSASYNVDALFQYLDDFDKLVREGDEKRIIGFSTDPLKETENWPVDLPALDVETPIARSAKLNNQIVDMQDLAAKWELFYNNPNLYDLKEEERGPMREKAHQVLGDIKDLSAKAEYVIVDLRQNPFTYDEEAAEQDYASQAYDLASIPDMYNLYAPTMTSQSFSIKNNRSGGNGREAVQSKRFIPEPPGHWFPGRSRGRLEIVWINISLESLPFDLRLSYRGLFRRVEPQGRFFKLIGNNIEGAWTPAGTSINVDDNHRLMGIAFRLEGDGAGAFYVQYGVHCGRKASDSSLAGNSPSRPPVAIEEFVQNRQPVEGIRLAIWPREFI